MIKGKNSFSLLRQYFRPFRITDDRLTLQHFFHTVSRYSRTRKHDRDHAKHQESHDDLHGILNKCHHISHLHLTIADSMCSGPYNQNRDSVHDQHHCRHHKCHRTIDKKIRLCQFYICVIKSFLFMLFCTKCTDNRQSCQNFSGHKVQLIHKLLKHLKFRHCHNKE